MCGDRGGLAAAWADYRAGRLASAHVVCEERIGLFRNPGDRDRARQCESLAKSAVGSHDLGIAGRAVTGSLEPRR